MNIKSVALPGSVASFALFVLVAKYGGVSAGTAVNMQVSFLTAFLASGAMDLTPFTAFALSLVFLALSMSFLTFYGFYSAEKKLGNVAGIINAAIAILVFQSAVGVLIAVAMILVSGYLVSLSNTYSKELKRWVRFRVGSNSVSKALLVFNVFLALGVLAAVSMDTHYQEGLKSGLKSAMLSATDNNALPPEQSAILRQQAGAQIDAALQSNFFLSYFKWLAAISALSVFVIMEFFRNVVLSNLAGVFTFVMIKIHGEKE